MGLNVKRHFNMIFYCLFEQSKAHKPLFFKASGVFCVVYFCYTFCLPVNNYDFACGLFVNFFLSCGYLSVDNLHPVDILLICCPYFFSERFLALCFRTFASFYCRFVRFLFRFRITYFFTWLLRPVPRFRVPAPVW